jgi:heat shock protein HslJ
MKVSPLKLGGMGLALLIAWMTLGNTALADKITPDVELVNTYWRAVEIEGNAVTLQPRQREPHFVLAAEGNRVHGYTGCNQLLGTFSRTSGGLQFKPLATTRRACPPPESAMEVAFLRALEATVSYELTGDTLALKDAEGRVRMRLKAQYLR